MSLEWTGEQAIPELMPGDARELQAHTSRYVFALQFCTEQATRPNVEPTHHVLDVACGCGYGTMILSWVAKRALGVDRSLSCIVYAQQHYRTSRTNFFRGDAQELAGMFAAESYNTVISFETVEHLEDPEKFIAAVHHILKPGGTFVVSAPHASTSCFHVPREGQPHGNYTHDELWSLLCQYFEEERMEYWCQDKRTNFYREEQVDCPIRTHIIVARK